MLLVLFVSAHAIGAALGLLALRIDTRICLQYSDFSELVPQQHEETARVGRTLAKHSSSYSRGQTCHHNQKVSSLKSTQLKKTKKKEDSGPFSAPVRFIYTSDLDLPRLGGLRGPLWNQVKDGLSGAPNLTVTIRKF